MSYNATDLGNARRLMEKCGAYLRYIPRWRAWRYWEGTYWAEDLGSAQLINWLWKLSDRLQKEAASDKERKVALSWENMPTVRRIVEAAESLREYWIDPPAMDSDPWLLGTPGGTVDLRSGELRKAEPGEYISRRTAVAPRFDQPIPIWESFLARILGDDEELIASMRRLLGYCLTGETSQQVLAVFYGTGANGKSTLLEAVAGVLGDYATAGAPGVLESHDQDRHPCEIADLAGRRLVTLAESDRGVRFSEGLVKRITGEKTLKGRFMHQDWFEFPVTFKVVYAVNHQPMLASADHGIQRRLLQVPFSVRISAEERDLHLPEKLRAEYPGILAWLIQGCREYQREGLSPAAAVRSATCDYLALQDTVGDFLAECTEPGGFTPSAAIYARWCQWAQRHGEKEISHRLFVLRLAERDIERVRTGYDKGWSLTLKSEETCS